MAAAAAAIGASKVLRDGNRFGGGNDVFSFRWLGSFDNFLHRIPKRTGRRAKSGLDCDYFHLCLRVSCDGVIDVSLLSVYCVRSGSLMTGPNAVLVIQNPNTGFGSGPLRTKRWNFRGKWNGRGGGRGRPSNGSGVAMRASNAPSGSYFGRVRGKAAAQRTRVRYSSG